MLYVSGTAPLTSSAIPQETFISSSLASLPKSVQQQMQQPLNLSPLLEQGSDSLFPETSYAQESPQETGSTSSDNNYHIYSNTSDPDAGIRMISSGDLVIEKSVIDLFGLCTADSRYCKR
ncbi:MAG: hypothetical protein LRY39_02190 [Alphaproteobacteria bacterium]|nr:hypothetical protein [Alphaproteobacteria bacterium]